MLTSTTPKTLLVAITVPTTNNRQSLGNKVNLTKYSQPKLTECISLEDFNVFCIGINKCVCV